VVRSSVVRKLWLTIVALVLFILLILALYLQQFFASYVRAMQDRDLMSQVLLVSELLEREPNQMLAYDIGAHVMTALHSHYYLIPPPDQSPAVARLVAGMPAKSRQALASGQPVIASGMPPFVKHPDPSTDLYALMPVETPLGQPEALLLITESSSVAGDPERTISSLIIFAVVLGTLLTTGLAFVVSKNLSNPLLEMNSVAETMARGRFDQRVRVVTRDEVGRLGQTLNHLASELNDYVHALTKEKEEISGILGAMTDAVVAADVDGHVRVLNATAMRWLAAAGAIDAKQLVTADSVGEGLERIESLPGQGEPTAVRRLTGELRAMHEEVLATRSGSEREFTWHSRIFLASMSPLFEPDDPERMRGTLAVLRDVTKERKLDRLRKDFIANVSHELRTPLALFQGYSEALLDEFGDDPETRREMTTIIYEESMRMRRLVNDLLDLAQVESSSFTLRTQPIDVAPVVRRVARKFQSVCMDRGVALKVDAPEEPCIVAADADRMEQILTNLVDNALRHTHEGGIQLRVSASADQVVIDVEDTGEGIAREDLPFVFERFYKADKARTRSQGGTGLGLAIVVGLVHAHGGSITVDSEPGQGTVFHVSLPRYVARQSLQSPDQT
jgi:two-component system sensor histidine kinase ResE